jgi:hypothetical protein
MIPPSTLVRLVGAVLLGLALASLPFLHYRLGAAHHARDAGAAHASHPHAR